MLYVMKKSIHLQLQCKFSPATCSSSTAATVTASSSTQSWQWWDRMIRHRLCARYDRKIWRWRDLAMEWRLDVQYRGSIDRQSWGNRINSVHERSCRDTTTTSLAPPSASTTRSLSIVGSILPVEVTPLGAACGHAKSPNSWAPFRLFLPQ